MLQAVRKWFDGVDEAAVSWHRQNILTPDIWKLEQSQFQNIFIPDDMMMGNINNHLIADAAREGTKPTHPACFTLEQFTMFEKDLGEHSFPIPMPKDYEPSGYFRVRPRPAKIKGQLYTIFSQRIKKLDIHRQNGVQFQRIRTLIHLPHRQVKFSKERPLPEISREYFRSVEAWMYVGIPSYWDDMIGDLLQIRECDQYSLDNPKIWLENYYKFE